MNPLVSVCIPCHNAAPYIGKAIESILAQSWPLIEVIVVDDGSSDASGAILDSYASPRLLVIHQENRGQCSAANRALEVAQGDLIKFFDADDILASMSIEAQVYRLKGNTDAVASAQWGRFYRNDLSTFKLTQQSVWRDLSSHDWLTEAWAYAQPMMQCGLWLIPRPILEQCGGWDESLSLINDFEFFSRVLCNASEVLFTPEATLYYRSGISGSLSGQKSRKAVESAFHSLLKGTGHLLKRRSDPESRLSCANMLQNFIYTYYPDHPDLRQAIELRVQELGGSTLEPVGPPRFQQMRRLIGWRAARRVQRILGR